MKSKLTLIILFLVISCTNNDLKEYDFVYYSGATGINTYIIENDQEVAIKFHPLPKH